MPAPITRPCFTVKVTADDMRRWVATVPAAPDMAPVVASPKCSPSRVAELVRLCIAEHFDIAPTSFGLDFGAWR